MGVQEQRVEFKILGPLSVTRDGQPLALTRAKHRALLLALLLRPNEVVSTDRLIDALWGGAPPATAPVALHGHVSQLRKQLPPDTLQTESRGYLLRVEPGTLDLERFERLREDGRDALAAGRPQRAAAALAEALALWRGEPPSDLSDDSVLRTEVERLEELRATALEERVEAELALGRHAELVAELEALVRASPFRERLRAQLMTALYRAGRQADALQVYQDGRQALVEELGIEPGPALQRLQQQILQQDPALQATGGAPERELFVGRGEELRTLRAAVDDAIAGRGRVALLAGEAGIGKTRLAAETEAYAARSGAMTLWGRCYEGETAPAYWPWVQILRGYVDACPQAELPAEIADGRIARFLSDSAASGDGDHDRFRLFDAISVAVRAAARRQPLVLVLEDLHWADTTSLLVLQFVASTIRDARVLVVGTQREDDEAQADQFETVLTQLRREPLCIRLALRGLDEVDVGALVTAAAGAGSASLAPKLHVETGGNPFFVQEIVRHLIETGRIEGEAAGAELELPDSVRDVVARRISRLSDACKELLTVAAVFGEFSERVVARMLGLDRVAVVAALDEAVGAGVIVEVGYARYAFAHALLRDALDAELDAVARADLHRRAGEALEQAYGDDVGAHVGELAHHFFEAARAGDVRKAVEYSRRAAARETAQLAYEQAAQHLGRALQLLELQDDVSRQERCDLLLTLGDAYWRSGSFREARLTFREAAELARSLDDWRALARSALGYAGGAGFEITARNDFSTQLLSEAIAALPEDEVLLRARLQARLGQALIPYPDRAEERFALVREALALARDDPSTLAYVITPAHFALWLLENVEEQLAMMTELIELGRALQNDAHIQNGLSWRIPTYAELGDIEGFDRDLREFERLFERRPVSYARWGLFLLQAMRALLAGDRFEGRRLAELALESGQRDGNPNALQVFAIQSIGLYRMEGANDELTQLLELVVEQYPEVAGWRAILAAVYARAGREDDARRELDRITSAGLEQLPRDFIWTTAAAFSAEAAALVGSEEQADALYALLEPFAHLHVVLGGALYDGPVARRLGLLAARLGRWEAAEAQFAAAVEADRRIGAWASLALTEADFAEALLKAGSEEAAERAAALVEHALGEAERLDIRPLRERLLALGG